MMMFILGLIIGAIVGASAGILLAGLCVASRESDDDDLFLGGQ